MDEKVQKSQILDAYHKIVGQIFMQNLVQYVQNTKDVDKTKKRCKNHIQFAFTFMLCKKCTIAVNVVVLHSRLKISKKQ